MSVAPALARHAGSAATLGALALLSALGWAWLAPMDGMAMAAPWNAAAARMAFAMWAVMMAAMMLPSAAPAALIAERVLGRAAALRFVAGYLAVWTLFSAGATLLQWAIAVADAARAVGWFDLPAVAGGTLVAAGLFQFAPLKHACLRRCRTPLGVVLGAGGRGGSALRAGASHGASCVGCCWALMALLFVFGAMNLVAAVALAALTLAERLLPWPAAFARAVGVGLVGWGAWAILR